MSRRGAARLGCADLWATFTRSRRSFLRVGALGAAGLGLADLLRAEATTPLAQAALAKASAVPLRATATRGRW